MYNFSDNRSAPVAPVEMEQVLFHRNNSPDHAGGSLYSYFDEVSDGQIQVTGDVFGWYTLPRSQYDENGEIYACPPPGEDALTDNPIYDDVHQAAAADEFDPSNYDVIVYGSNQQMCTGWIYGNEITVSANSAGVWLVMIHELGHALGLDHANVAENCTENGQPVPWSANCTVRQYGDGFSTMGWGMGLGHVSGIDKMRLGVWTRGVDVVEATGTGSFTLRPVTAGPGGPRGLWIPTSTHANRGPRLSFTGVDPDMAYYLEYRTPDGFNTYTQSGHEIRPDHRAVYVRIGTDPRHRQLPMLLDMDPTGTSWAMQEGVWYDDVAEQISFRVRPGSATASQVVVEVREIPPPPSLSVYLRCESGSVLCDAIASGGSGAGYQFTWTPIRNAMITGQVDSGGISTAFGYCPSPGSNYGMRVMVEDSAGNRVVRSASETCWYYPF
jgi:hypothetical protein